MPAVMRAVANDSGDVVRVAGPLEVSSATDLRTALHAAIDAGSGDLVVDLSGVEVVDASGLGVLVGAHRRAQRIGRRLVLRGVPPRISRLLLVTRLNRVIPTEPLDVSVV